MITRNYEGLIRRLMDEYCMFLVDVLLVDSVYEWCREHGIDEPDKDKPLRLVVNEEKGCKLVVNKNIPEGVISDRIKALSIRSALTNVASNKADMLDSDKKRIAYLFLSEYASSMPDVEDEIIADNWAFDEMEKLDFFKE